MKRFDLLLKPLLILFYLNKFDNGLNNKSKRFINRMFNSNSAVLFLIRLFHEYNYYAPND